MFSMPETPGEAEQYSRQYQETVRPIAREAIIWAFRLALIAYIVGVLYGTYREDEVQLYLLHWTVKVFQTVAHGAGFIALLAENRYNEIVSTLH